MFARLCSHCIVSIRDILLFFFGLLFFRTRFNEFLVCQNRNGDDACKKQLKMYRSICPQEWVDNWTEAIENDTFPGVTFKTAEAEEHH